MAGAKTPSVVIDAEPKPEIVETEQPIAYSTVPDMTEVKETPAVECNIIAGEGEHIVQQGENLYSIARRYGITVANLRNYNGFNSNSEVIYPCSPLRIKSVQVVEDQVVAIEPEPRTESDIPTAANVVVRSKAIKKEAKPVVKMDCNIDAAEGEHVVQQGENLYSIARQYNVNVNKLMTWNGKKENDLIYPCTKLVVAAPSVSMEEKPAVVLETPKSYATVVKPKKVTPKKAMPVSYAAVARPKTTAKKTGAPEKTPALFVKKGSDLCVVKKGESVSSLANRSDMTESQFRALNNLGEKEGISIGQVLKCKDCSCNEPIEEAVPKSYNVVVKSKKIKTDDDLTEVVLPKPMKVKEAQAVAVKSVDRTRKFHVVKMKKHFNT
ncbi:MAG: LysM peptidoglycan-binding domain-containing protein, partial [Saprospiraceae bacterium]|nr:LysM peptidoglycan-binding domain-containing protein [Saprospiraceae bacterium]